MDFLFEKTCATALRQCVAHRNTYRSSKQSNAKLLFIKLSPSQLRPAGLCMYVLMRLSEPSLDLYPTSILTCCMPRPSGSLCLFT